MICVGSDAPAALKDLAEIEDPEQVVEIRQLYASLGHRLKLEVESVTRKAASDALAQQGRADRKGLDWTAGALEKTRQQVAQTRGVLESTRTELVVTRRESNAAPAACSAPAKKRER